MLRRPQLNGFFRAFDRTAVGPFVREFPVPNSVPRVAADRSASHRAALNKRHFEPVEWITRCKRFVSRLQARIIRNVGVTGSILFAAPRKSVAHQRFEQSAPTGIWVLDGPCPETPLSGKPKRLLP